uniref:CAB/ELIP/HLIP superfamily protein n=1 Tax=Ahnfeltia plicata TaxID=28023 RepID=A0A1C9CB75_9FLOR|nr:CAB/ELIP/HLIP superfamily protein [Ahnfeltia plicata]YP_010204051.1 CAB/ELIP/HLIP superfamily protein [Ahnfeltia fastigiata]AOM65627.1 CAB/ELIP/HLIP superfamily protein [Ahnfeltia plicata]UAT97291.1 CAB/ELIP/HLIP superfamily protein [Ahnfeltia plicata]UAT97496.1 CAB/ELIP/HLIP superfamily protein [Ahnfeltia plicata]UAT97700.1 CAB/ELIP/HLIP superfamily protein [Ahnfeltia fastigiata]UAT97904.1 CAB/ELIP/HLIP superfamily protein [Ahnfeltia fastigiata]
MKSNYRNQWIWGFTEGAENWNGRLAMLAFIIVFLVEFFSSKSILSNLGVG